MRKRAREREVEREIFVASVWGVEGADMGSSNVAVIVLCGECGWVGEGTREREREGERAR